MIRWGSWRSALAAQLSVAALGAIAVGATAVLALQVGEQAATSPDVARALVRALRITAGQLPFGVPLLGVVAAAWIATRWRRAGWLRGLGAAGIGPSACVPIAALVLGTLGGLLRAAGAFGGPPAPPVEPADWVPITAMLAFPWVGAVAGGAGFELGARGRWASAIGVAALLSAAALWLELGAQGGAAEGWTLGWLLGPTVGLCLGSIALCSPGLSKRRALW